jgi:transposase-like protein
MFTPPVCPHPDCQRHQSPEPGFFIRKGHYRARCRAYPIARFRCRSCRRSFSHQTFRADYRDHKPHLNVPLFLLLVSGVGLRQASRNLGLSRHCTHRKFQKIGRQLRAAHQHLLGDFTGGAWFQMDELGTFEQDRHTGPLTLPIAIEANSLLIVAAESAPIRPSGKKTKAQKARIQRHEQRHGRRPDRSRAAVRSVLEVVAQRAARLPRIVLRTDQKAMYVPLARSVFGAERLEHQRVSGKLPRTVANPIFKINLTDAMARDNNGRLRRRSWLHSKKREYLDLQLAVFLAYRNYVRRRTNEEEESPAQKLGFTKERLRPEEMLSWSQRFGERSVAIPSPSWAPVTVAAARQAFGAAPPGHPATP